MPMYLEEYRSGFKDRSNYAVIGGVSPQELTVLISFLAHFNRAEIPQDAVFSYVDAIRMSGFHAVAGKKGETEFPEFTAGEDKLPPPPSVKVVPVAKTEAKKDPAPPAQEAQGEDTQSEWFRLPTVKQIVKKIVEGGTKDPKAVLAKCEELQGLGVPALDVVQPEDLPERVKSALAALG